MFPKFEFIIALLLIVSSIFSLSGIQNPSDPVLQNKEKTDYLWRTQNASPILLEYPPTKYHFAVTLYPFEATDYALAYRQYFGNRYFDTRLQAAIFIVERLRRTYPNKALVPYSEELAKPAPNQFSSVGILTKNTVLLGAGWRIADEQLIYVISTRHNLMWKYAVYMKTAMTKAKMVLYYNFKLYNKFYNYYAFAWGQYSTKSLFIEVIINVFDGVYVFWYKLARYKTELGVITEDLIPLYDFDSPIYKLLELQRISDHIPQV